MTVNGTTLALAAALAFGLAAQAQAHAKLVSASPAVNASVAGPTQISLKFSEKLQPKFSGFDVSKGGARLPMASAVAKDRLTMTAASPRPLAPGAYKVSWRAVTADTHRTQGTYAFTVR
ncbi:MAG TPA: copper homeostasis periplasmic binding protein CopC [Phenylobacterium sp.]|nr:copper homeostasis periplasmic binding protein CopC [Phenylobacterium sp.]